MAGLQESSVGFSPPKAFFAYGLGNSVSFPLWTGSTVILLEDRPTAENTLAIMNAMKPTHYYGIPTLYAAQLQLLEQGFEADLSSIEFCATGGEALPPALFDRWKALTGHEIIDSIGSSEVLHFYTCNRPGQVKPGTAGPIVPGYEGRIVDRDGNELPDGEAGELAIKGESVARYYWNKPEKTAAAMRGEWFYTGDTCIRDEDGCYIFCGRGGDMLKVGGIWVSPIEIEAALVEHTAVLEAAVIGAPDADQLVKPKAFVVLKDPDAAGSDMERELGEFIRNKLARFKYPRWIEFVDELPKTSSGKIQRFRLHAPDSGRP
jgi:benzoate-CoA ligase family protein